MTDDDENRGFAVEPLTWQVHDVQLVQVMPVGLSPEIIGEQYAPVRNDRKIRGFRLKDQNWFVSDNHLTADDLPTEFFNHQLLEYDHSDEEDLMAFISTWGMPYSPQRNSKFCLAAWGSEVFDTSVLGISETRHLELALTETDPNVKASLRNDISGKVAMGIDILADNIIRTETRACIDTRGDVISVNEASTTLYVLQQASRLLTSIASSGSWISSQIDQVIGTLMAGSCHPMTLKSGTYWYHSSMNDLDLGLSSHGLLTSAVCNQMIAAVADKAPWRECQCEGCNRIFKRKQSKSGNPDSNSIYCCDACMERQKKRNQRKAAKNRIQH